MSELNPARSPDSATANHIPLEPPPKSEPPTPEKITLWGEIIKGWEWVVFGWKTIQRIGSFTQIMRTLFVVISLLINRTLVQWGIIKNK